MTNSLKASWSLTERSKEGNKLNIKKKKKEKSVKLELTQSLMDVRKVILRYLLIYRDLSLI